MVQGPISETTRVGKGVDDGPERKGRELDVSSWNVRTLVEESGDAKICRRGRYPISSGSVHRKFDFLINELRRFDVDVAAVQEIKWFGQDIWTSFWLYNAALWSSTAGRRTCAS